MKFPHIFRTGGRATNKWIIAGINQFWYLKNDFRLKAENQKMGPFPLII